VLRALEDISFKLRIPQRKPWQRMTDDIVKATKVMVDDQKVPPFFVSSFDDWAVLKHTQVEIKGGNRKAQ